MTPLAASIPKSPASKLRAAKPRERRIGEGDLGLSGWPRPSAPALRAGHGEHQGGASRSFEPRARGAERAGARYRQNMCMFFLFPSAALSPSLFYGLLHLECVVFALVHTPRRRRKQIAHRSSTIVLVGSSTIVLFLKKNNQKINHIYIYTHIYIYIYIYIFSC